MKSAISSEAVKRKFVCDVCKSKLSFRACVLKREKRGVVGRRRRERGWVLLGEILSFVLVYLGCWNFNALIVEDSVIELFLTSSLFFLFSYIVLL